MILICKIVSHAELRKITATVKTFLSYFPVNLIQKLFGNA